MVQFVKLYGRSLMVYCRSENAFHHYDSFNGMNNTSAWNLAHKIYRMRKSAEEQHKTHKAETVGDIVSKQSANIYNEYTPEQCNSSS